MSNIYNDNRRYINNDTDCLYIIEQIYSVKNFIDDLSYLLFGRDYIRCKDYVFSFQNIFLSMELTIENIIECCKSFCIADANTLLRKYRDDLFFMLYICVYDSIKYTKNTKQINRMENNIEKWLKNNLCDLSINEILKQIGSSAHLRAATVKYNMQEKFREIGIKLNNYVHGNGFMFYNKNAICCNKNDVICLLKEINKHIHYITTVFLFLLTLSVPQHITSTDYLDCLENNCTPSDEMKYWVAPFIEKFINENIYLVDKDGLEYLKEMTDLIWNE